MSPIQVLVTGASGRTGRPVIQALARAGLAPRAFIRDAAKAPALLALGAADYAVGDLSDPDSLARAMEGCARVVHIGPPMEPREVEQTEALLEAARAAGASHFIYYSVMHPLRREVRHHKLKLDAEERVIESGLPYTILQPIRYMQHLEPIWREVTEQGVHAMPFDVDKRFNLVDLLDLAEAAAVVASQPGHLSATYELAGPQSLSMRDVAAELASRLNRPVEARAIPFDDYEANLRAKDLAEDRVQQMLTMNRHYDAYGFLGNPNVLTWLIGRPPTPFSDYVQRLIARG